MNRYDKALSLAKAATLHGWAQVLRNVLKQRAHTYKDLSEGVEAVIMEMEDRSKEWSDTIHPHPPEQRN